MSRPLHSRPRPLSRCFGLLLALLVACASAPVCAHDLITSRAALTDPAGDMDIQSVIAADAAGRFQPSGTILVAGYTGAAHWLRITVQPPPDDKGFELRIQPTFLDEVALYEPDPARPGSWRQRLTGDRHVNPDRPVTTLGFHIAGSPTETVQTYYLRLETTSSSLLAVRALTPDDARADDMWRQFIHMLYLGVMLAMAVLTAYGLIGLHSRLAAVFLLYLGAQTASFIGLNGYLAYLFPADHAAWGDISTSILVLASVATGALFYRSVFHSYAASPLGLRLLEGGVVLFFVELILMAVGHIRLAMQINSDIVLLLGLAAPVIAMSMRSGPKRERRIITRLVWLQTAALCAMMLPLMGLVSSRVEWVIETPLSQGIAAALVIGAILHLQVRGLSEARQRAETDMAVARRLLEVERHRFAEQARFMDMLTHELKTPIATARLALQIPDASAASRHHALATLADMDAVVERCRQLDRLQQGRFVPHREPCQLDKLLNEVLTSCQASGRISTSAAPTPVMDSDRYLLKIILSNLVDNALKYSAPESDITCRIEPQTRDGKPYVCFTIANAPGPAGLPDPDQLFNKYYRSPHAHRYTGSGLGLYIVHHLAERLSGWIDYQPVHQRAQFTLWIPV